jgi:hypothetical protein
VTSGISTREGKGNGFEVAGIIPDCGSFDEEGGGAAGIVAKGTGRRTVVAV